MTYISCFSDFAFYFYYYFMENCHTWIIISMWQNGLHTNTSRSVWPILYGLMIKMLQYKMYPAGELRWPTTALVFFFVFFLSFLYPATLCVCLSVHPSARPSVSHTSIRISSINGCSPDLVCALIWWRSGLGLLMGKFRQFWQSYLPKTCPYFRFRIITVNIKGLSPIWYVHWYCRDLV